MDQCSQHWLLTTLKPHLYKECCTNFEFWLYYAYGWLYPWYSLTKLLDDMGNRIDDLEKNIAELMTQAGVEEGRPWVCGWHHQLPLLSSLCTTHLFSLHRLMVLTGRWFHLQDHYGTRWTNKSLSSMQPPDLVPSQTISLEGIPQR